MIGNLFPSLPLIFRMGFAFFISLLLFLFLGRRFIIWLKRIQMVDYFRVYSPSTHKVKVGTPTGGGLLVLFCLMISMLLMTENFNIYVLLILITAFYMGWIGFMDDLIKRFRKNSRGFSGKVKLLLQSAIGIFLGFYIYRTSIIPTWVSVPFSDIKLELNWIYPVAFFLIILGSTNSVNLSDGLDGLTAGCMIGPAIVFIVLAYIQVDKTLSSAFNLPYISGIGEVGIFWCALLGALSGFLRYNKYPARLFMGGVGSEFLGGVLGISAVFLKAELLLMFVGIVFILEALSVIIQVVSFRLRGKRIFKMTPLHHHFELKGMKEKQIVFNFWIISGIFSLIGVMSIFW